MHVTIATEGFVDAAIARRLLRECGLEAGPEYGRKGKGHIDANIARYNQASASTGPWLVLRDLDNDAPCGGVLARRLLKSPAPKMRLRIVVRAIESWLLADFESLAKTFDLRASAKSRFDDRTQHPKMTMLDLLAESKSMAVRRAMVRVSPNGAKESGALYNSNLASYVDAHWRPKSAAKNSSSLAKALARVEELASRP